MRNAHSNDELSKALESLLYEMVILASAVLLRDKRYFFKKYPNLLWGTAQIAHDVIRLKSRLLYDFFFLRPRDADDTVVQDFGLNDFMATIDVKLIDRIMQFNKKQINKWTAHLTWTRTREREYTKADRELMEQYAMDLLCISGKFAQEVLAKGVCSLNGWAVPYYNNFTRLYTYLHQTPRVDEGNVKWPNQQISLEDFTI